MLDSAGVGDWDLDLSTFDARHSLRHDQCFGYSEPVPGWSPRVFFAHVHPEDREFVGTVQDASGGRGATGPSSAA